MTVAFLASYYIAGNGYKVYATINSSWNEYGGDDASASQLFIRYFVVLFPTLDVISTAPVRVIALANNMAGVMLRHQPGRGDLGEEVGWAKIAFYLAVMNVPSFLAFFLSDVAKTLSFLSLLTLFAQYIFPVVFVMVALQQCRDRFGRRAARNAGHFTTCYSRKIIHRIFFFFCVLLLAYESLTALHEYGVSIPWFQHNFE